MTGITFARFKSIVSYRVGSDLAQYGYQPLLSDNNEEAEPEYAAIEFQKKLLSDVYCTIGFQLLKHYIYPKREFQVILDRRQHPTSLQSDHSETDYAYLKLDLRNVLQIYDVDPFPEGVFFWSFMDEKSLSNGLSEALALVMKYGIPWLEDPSSNMDWK